MFSLFIKLILLIETSKTLKFSKKSSFTDKPKLVASPSTNLLNGDVVKVSWTNISLDLDSESEIQLICQLNEKTGRFVESRKIIQKSREITSGFVRFQVLYTRSDCMFRYQSKNKHHIVETIAQSNPIKFAYNIATPMHVHISLTGKQDEMKIMWISGSKSAPCVKYSTVSSSETLKCDGTSTTYKASDMCDSPANSTGYIDPGFIHSIVISNLSHQTLYFYQVGSNNIFSNVYNFTSPPHSSLAFTPVSMVIFGDLSTYNNPPYNTINSIGKLKESSRPPNIILHVGDVSYARGKGYIWEEFGSMIEKVAATVPYMVSIGNHEQLFENGKEKDPSGEPDVFIKGQFSSDSRGECSVPMIHRFSSPSNGNKLFWYSFDYGPVHVVMLCSELNFTKNSRQYKWFVEDLEKVNRRLTPWLIVSMHRPVYNPSVSHPFWLNHYLLRDIEPLLVRYKVNFFFNGHQHYYRRSCSLNGLSCIPANSTSLHGVVHLTVGSGGMLERGEVATDKPWIVKVIQDYGYGKMDFINATHAEWTFYGSKKHTILDTHIYTQDI